jgi:hypothetical protein
MRLLVPTIAFAAAIVIVGFILLVVSYFSGTAVAWLSSLSPQGVTWFRSGCLLFTIICLAIVGMRLNKRYRDEP